MSASPATIAATSLSTAAVALPEVPRVVFPEGYTMLRELGSGAFGTAYKVQRDRDAQVRILLDIYTSSHRSSDDSHFEQIFAMKAINTKDMDAQGRLYLRREILTHRALKHENIVQYCGVVEDVERQMLFIILEYCPGGELTDLINEHRVKKSYIPENVIWTYTRQLVRALHTCHDPSARSSTATTVIMHRDIKAANVLLNRKRSQVKLADFGLAREIEIDEWATSFCGTLDNMAPEFCSSNKSNVRTTEAVDIWSLGCLIYQLCTLRPLFKADDDKLLKEQILRGGVPCIPSCYSDELWHILAWMLTTSAADRATTTDLLEVPGIKYEHHLKKLSETLEENRALKERSQKVADQEAQIEFLKQQLADQEQLQQQVRLECEESLRFYEREHSKLTKKVEAEQAARERLAATLAQTHEKIEQLEERAKEDQLELDVRVQALANREAAFLVREKSLEVDLEELAVRRQVRTQGKRVEKVAMSAVRSIHTKQSVAVTTSVQKYTRSVSDTSCNSSESSADSSSMPSETQDTSRVPRSSQRIGKGAIVSSTIASERKRVDVASRAKAAIEVAAANGKRKLDALNGAVISGTVLADVKKRPRMHFQLAGSRQRV
ncbi:hypothetical protein QFC22_005684 [Naganishia vaughanmartiniae]|uniref:Uncharacterized protein n=1 Tax=Naganishia vaughanmartiniae TaxID=1424756 RepID=A0ACC2WRI7_9TREE|nr:hypothetical protein QFC22_005684 [Naganishia vaughanmartiniae]